MGYCTYIYSTSQYFPAQGKHVKNQHGTFLYTINIEIRTFTKSFGTKFNFLLERSEQIMLIGICAVYIACVESRVC